MKLRDERNKGKKRKRPSNTEFLRWTRCLNKINTQLTLKDSQFLLTTASDWKDLASEQTITPWMILIWTRSSGS